MVFLTILCHINPQAMIRLFSSDPQVLAFGSNYLRIISWNFLAAGLAFTTSSIFQGIGNTLPPLASSGMRFFLFAIPAYIMSTLPGFHIQQVWYLSVATVVIQAVVNVILLHREFDRKLKFPEAAPAIVPDLAAMIE
jgi:Na+-driven multidrug efflux pump